MPRGPDLMLNPETLFRMILNKAAALRNFPRSEISTVVYYIRT